MGRGTCTAAAWFFRVIVSRGSGSRGDAARVYPAGGCRRAPRRSHSVAAGITERCLEIRRLPS